MKEREREAILEVLLEARELAVKHNAKGAFALDAAGRAVMPLGNNGVCFCARGAIQHVSFKHQRGFEAQTFLSNAAWKLFKKNVVAVNDQLGVEAVGEMFDTAIELVRAQR